MYAPGASYDERLGEFVLPYQVVRTAADPVLSVTAAWGCNSTGSAENPKRQ